MSPRTSWRVRLPDLAALLDDPRVHAVLIEPRGLPDVRDAAGERLDLWLPPMGASLARALARRPEALDDDAFVFSSVPCAAGVALHVRRRAGQDQLGLPAELTHVVSRGLAVGASVLVTAPTVAARALGVGMVARAAAAAGLRLLALPAAREQQALTIEPAALDALSLDHVVLVAGELASGAARVLAARVPCVASVPGLDLEAGVARLLACLALDVPAMPHAIGAGWVARRFELIVELDAHRIVALAELHPGSDGGHTIQRVARRSSEGTFDVELTGSRIEHLLGGDHRRPKLSAPSVSPTTVARPPKAEPEPSLPARVAEHAPRASEQARGSELMRGSVIVRANGARTYPTRRSDPPPPARPPTAGPPPSSRLTPLVEPPPLSANSHRLAVSGPSGLGAEAPEPTADLATASAPRIGRIGRHELAELTADQLVSQSFIVDVGDPAPMPELEGLDDEASAAGVLAFDEHTASGVDRAPLERLSTEVADAATGGSLVASLPPLVIGGGGGDETMQIPATLLRPPSVQLAELPSEPAPPLELSDDDDEPVAPAPLDEDDRAGRTAMGALTHDEDAAPSRPPTSGRPRARRAKP